MKGSWYSFSMKDFWHKLRRPFFVLAPMANVTDAAFRTMIAKYGKPDVMWTEFVSADGLISAGKKRLLVDLKYSEKERPIVAQLFTGHPEAMEKAAKIIRKLKFDGLDINMGCPDKAVEKQGGGAAMIKDRKNALAVLEAAREGFGGPVSVKTRLGYNKVDMDWLRFILEQKVPALTVHLRTRKEMSLVPAHWELMPDILKLRDQVSPGTLVIGNGDVISWKDANGWYASTDCDGVMIGRGIFGKPWLFSDYAMVSERPPLVRLKILMEHAKLFEKMYCGRKRIKGFDVMKKHFKAYVSGWDGAKELRVKLMETKNAKEVKKVVGDYLLALRNDRV